MYNIYFESSFYCGSLHSGQFNGTCLIDALCVIFACRPLSTGEYVFLSVDSGLAPFEIYTYRPDFPYEIWHGLINMEPLMPAAEVWENFALGIIEEFQDPVSLTHCGLVTPYGNIDPDKHWFR